MGKTIISEGKTTAEAIEKGLKELHISKENAEIKVLEEKKKSFFSILDPHVVKVEITVKEGAPTIQKENTIKEDTSTKKENVEIKPETIEKTKEYLDKFLKELLPKISDKIEYTIIEEQGVLTVRIKGEGSAKLIGYRGEALNALQLIVSSVIKNKVDESIRIIIDVEEYRNKREKTLEELANKLEKTVVRNGKSITLEPMTPYERKVIHTALQDSKNVKTYSIGEGEHRRVVISKK